MSDLLATYWGHTAPMNEPNDLMAQPSTANVRRKLAGQIVGHSTPGIAERARDVINQGLGILDYYTLGAPSTMAGLFNTLIPGQPLGGLHEAREAAAQAREKAARTRLGRDLLALPEAFAGFGPASFARLRARAAPTTGSAGMPAPSASEHWSLASKNASIFDPPSKPPRPFHADYGPENPARADAAGRLTHTIDGDPINPSARVVGRRTLGGADEALSPAEIDASATAVTGHAVAAGSLRTGEVGRFRRDYDTAGNPNYNIFIQHNLTPTTKDRVVAHELGHAVDYFAGHGQGIPTTGILNSELKPVYNSLNNHNRGRPGTAEAGEAASWAKPVRPEHFSYKGGDVPAEYMAEAIRAYMQDPNYLKTVAPETAARIRQYVNTHPRLSEVLQLNTLAPFAAAPIAYGLLSAPPADGGS